MRFDLVPIDPTGRYDGLSRYLGGSQLLAGTAIAPEAGSQLHRRLPSLDAAAPPPPPPRRPILLGHDGARAGR